jgi:ubiquinone/menaquinone biosynthesis C-methylase UbiE/predicted NAD/FAD-dependent oxidoreductase
MTRIGIVGAGPGGLFATHLLEEYCGELCDITLFEADARVGGKVLTGQFETAPVLYEAGVAEFYDYSHFGPDPVRELVDDFGLQIVRMNGSAVILEDRIIRSYRDMRRFFGARSERVLREFHRTCRELCSPAMYYEGHCRDDNEHPWNRKTFREVLDAIPDEMARKYVEVAARSDVATEPHLTTALNGLKNILMDDPCYMRLYSIVGGNQRLVDSVAASLMSEIRLRSPVVRVAMTPDRTYRLTVRRDGRTEEHEFDLVVMALPNYWLQQVDWVGPALRRVLQTHLAHYDNPAHYLRITALFQEPFWRSELAGTYFRSDAFGGCCIYDEGARHPADPYGVLSWLIAGCDALALNNHDDDRLVQLALDALPPAIARGRGLFIEGRVNRWLGTVNGSPGGRIAHDLRRRHLPDPKVHPNLFLLGDYLFDSTVNGVFDSADFVAHMILSLLRKKKYGSPDGRRRSRKGVLSRDYHDRYDGVHPYEESWRDFFCERYTAKLIHAVWDWAPPYTLLDTGSAMGLTLEAFARIGVEAWGIENSPYIHAKTPRRWKDRNLLGDIRKLPFPDDAFDFVYDTCLSYVPERDLERAIRELYRVCRVGVVFADVTTDMSLDVIENYKILEAGNSLFTLLEWSEMFLRAGFRIATSDRKRLHAASKIDNDADEDDYHWYPDADSMRYCFYSKPNAPPPPPRKLRLRTRSLAATV